jgi:hypothetical protein
VIGVDDQPAHLEGYGPITAEVARRIAAQGTWRRLLTDPVSGAVLDVGRTRYLPPPDLADHVIARDQTCRFPTCTRTGRGLRPGPLHTVRAGRYHQCRQPGAAAPRSPQRQDPPPLAAATARTRPIHLDRAHRTPVPGRPGDRRTPRPTPAGTTGRRSTSRSHGGRPRPTTVLIPDRGIGACSDLRLSQVGGCAAAERRWSAHQHDRDPFRQDDGLSAGGRRTHGRRR